LWKRDGKSVYLVHIPRIWRLLEQDLDHPALGRITQWLDRYLPREARTALDVRGAA
jgi:aminoglycoside/choline kinase family phosphotransferase